VTITCRDLAEFLHDFVAGELPAEQLERFRAHLAECPPCVVYLETYQITIRLTRSLKHTALPPDVACRLREAMASVRPDPAG
jgi:anti-sigma factor RsiW